MQVKWFLGKDSHRPKFNFTGQLYLLTFERRVYMSKKWYATFAGSLLAAMLITGCAADDQDPPPDDTQLENDVEDEMGDTTGNGGNGGTGDIGTGEEGTPGDVTENGTDTGTGNNDTGTGGDAGNGAGTGTGGDAGTGDVTGDENKDEE